MDENIDSRTFAGHPNTWTGEGPVWCPRATLCVERAFGPGGKEIRRGSKHFAPGARIYLRRVMGYPDDVPDVEVVGRHRATHRYVRMIIRASWLENWRTDLVYSPQAIRLLWPKWDGTAASKEQAESFAHFFAKLAASTG